MRYLQGELPSVQKIYQDFRGKGLEVLLIDIREDPDQVRRTVKERGYIAPGAPPGRDRGIVRKDASLSRPCWPLP